MQRKPSFLNLRARGSLKLILLWMVLALWWVFVSWNPGAVEGAGDVEGAGVMLRVLVSW